MKLGKLLLGLTAALVVVTGGVLFVVLTGGLGGGGDGPPGSMAELTGEDLPPGVSRAGGITDAGALADAHNDSLQGRSYTARVTVEATTSNGDSSREVRQVQTSKVDGDGTFLTTFSREGGTSFTRTVWGNDSVALARTQVGDRQQYETADLARTRRNVSGHVVIGEVLAAGNFSLANLTQRDGRTVLELTADGAVPDGAGEMGSVESISAYSGTVVVGLDGTVYEMTVDMTFTDRRGLNNEATFRYTLAALGSTDADRPDWVSEAASRTDARVRPALAPAPLAA